MRCKKSQEPHNGKPSAVASGTLRSYVIYVYVSLTLIVIGYRYSQKSPNFAVALFVWVNPIQQTITDSMNFTLLSLFVVQGYNKSNIKSKSMKLVCTVIRIMPIHKKLLQITVRLLKPSIIDVLALSNQNYSYIHARNWIILSMQIRNEFQYNIHLQGTFQISSLKNISVSVNPELALNCSYILWMIYEIINGKLKYLYLVISHQKSTWLNTTLTPRTNILILKWGKIC